MKLDNDLFTKMREATRLLRTSGPAAATAAIQRMLRGGPVPDPVKPAPIWTAPAPVWTAPLQRAGVLHDINPTPPEGADTVDTVPESTSDILTRFRSAVRGNWAKGLDKHAANDVAADVTGEGKFLAASCTNQAGTRAYKLYVPSGYNGHELPLIIMLHGCQQDPDDFAAGTGMNSIAEEKNCFVAYPGQMQAANGSNCWNWFKADDQHRDQGEPSIIADITREISRTYRVDKRRIYVAGLSAGGAMAAIMGANYPELYAAVGIHSGLPVGAAHDLPSAFAAMKGGMVGVGPLKAQANASAARRQSIPVIVFHGDRDATVHPRNGDLALAQCTPDSPDKNSSTERQHIPDLEIEKGSVPDGHTYTRTIRRDVTGKTIAEQWIVHGAGHAWSGGSRSGSYTDPQGPNAAQEMMRFFSAHANNAQ